MNFYAMQATAGGGEKFDQKVDLLVHLAELAVIPLKTIVMNLFTIKSSSGEQISVVPIKGINHPHLLHSTNAFQTEGDFGNMLFQNIPFRSAELWYSSYQMFTERTFYGIVEIPVLEAHITLKDRYVQSIGEGDEVYQAGQFNITAAPFMENKVFFPKDGEYVTFDIHPSMPLLKNLAQDFKGLNKFLEALDKNPQHAVSLYSTPRFLSPYMNHLILKILNHLKRPAPKKTYIEILLQELLIIILLRGEEAKWPNWKLKQRDIDALHYSRELIIQEGEEYDNEDLYYTSIQLADKADLSLYKFKNGFKQLFGTTPYQYLIELRLYRAKMLLKNTKSSILEIALKTGYKSFAGFSRAYKKFFEISPSEERR